MKKISIPSIQIVANENFENEIPKLSKYSIDFTKLAREGKFDPCYGREKELLQIMEILARRQKGNPVLLGDPGVGKSAIVENFATNLVENLVPFVLQGRSLMSLNLPKLVGGCRFRGQFEKRLQSIIKEVLKNPQYLIFIDEIHLLAHESDKSSGSMDAANILKPVLSRGGFQCIGASTNKEYEIIEKDQALSRRFQPDYIQEPSIDHTLKILYSLRPILEAYHNVSIMSIALKTAIDVSVKYINDRYLPDKAIDILDTVSAKKVIKMTTIQKNSFVTSLINGILTGLSKSRLNAFRKGDISVQFVCQELEFAYNKFITKWLENPLKISEVDETSNSSLISEKLFDKIKLSILQHIETLLFSSFKNHISLIKSFINISSAKNSLILLNFFKKSSKKKIVKLSVYRISIFLYYILNSFNIKYLDFTILMFCTKYMVKLKYLMSKKFNIFYANRKDFRKMDLMDFTLANLNLEDYKKFIVYQKISTNIQPLIKKSLIKSLEYSEELNFSEDENLSISNLLGYTSFYKQNFLQKNNIFKNEINSDSIFELLSETLNIPKQSLSKKETTELLALEQAFHKKVIGQDEAISAIANAVRRAKLGIQNLNRPIASFLFCGPTGVGKTEIVKTLAYIMFGSEKKIIRFDMSEFMEKHSISRLIGSPPGYVGYSEGGQLTDAVRRTPYSIVLFDEAEKAHPDILNILLQILEDGRLSDTQKRLISFENTIIVLTSNAAAKEIQNLVKTEKKIKNPINNLPKYLEPKLYAQAFSTNTNYLKVVNFLKSPIKNNYLIDLNNFLLEELDDAFALNKKSKQDIINTPEENSKSLKDLVIQKLSLIFLPEFLNRFDDIIVFRPLSIEELGKIASIMIENIMERLKSKNVKIIVDENVKAKLSKEAYNPAFGARPLRRLITKQIEDKVSEIFFKLSTKEKEQIRTIKFELNISREIVTKIL